MRFETMGHSGRRFSRRGGFTLLELLVVIAIVSVLLTILAPSLRRARQRAGDVRCAGTMRGALVAVLMYRSDYPTTGLTNYAPDCPYFGRGWPGGGYGPHCMLQADGTIGDRHGPHIWNEGRSWMNYWRGYLLAGNYAESDALGCPYTGYVGEPFYASHNAGACTNQVETNPRQDSFRRAPAFVWYGPGLFNTDNVNEYAGGNLAVPGWGWAYSGSTYKVLFEGRGGPLLTCPQVWISYVGYKVFEPSHRPRWRVWPVVGTLKVLPYAENVGFTDGGVRFFENSFGGTFNPFD